MDLDKEFISELVKFRQLLKEGLMMLAEESAQAQGTKKVEGINRDIETVNTLINMLYFIENPNDMMKKVIEDSQFRAVLRNYLNRVWILKKAGMETRYLTGINTLSYYKKLILMDEGALRERIKQLRSLHLSLKPDLLTYSPDTIRERAVFLYHLGLEINDGNIRFKREKAVQSAININLETLIEKDITHDRRALAELADVVSEILKPVFEREEGESDAQLNQRTFPLKMQIARIWNFHLIEREKDKGKRKQELIDLFARIKLGDLAFCLEGVPEEKRERFNELSYRLTAISEGKQAAAVLLYKVLQYKDEDINALNLFNQYLEKGKFSAKQLKGVLSDLEIVRAALERDTKALRDAIGLVKEFTMNPSDDGILHKLRNIAENETDNDVLREHAKLFNRSADEYILRLMETPIVRDADGNINVEAVRNNLKAKELEIFKSRYTALQRLFTDTTPYSRIINGYRFDIRRIVNLLGKIRAIRRFGISDISFIGKRPYLAVAFVILFILILPAIALAPMGHADYHDSGDLGIAAAGHQTAIPFDLAFQGLDLPSFEPLSVGPGQVSMEPIAEAPSIEGAKPVDAKVGPVMEAKPIVEPFKIDMPAPKLPEAPEKLTTEDIIKNIVEKYTVEEINQILFEGKFTAEINDEKIAPWKDGLIGLRAKADAKMEELGYKNKELVAALQRELKLNEDGKFGSGTAKALRDYLQKATKAEAPAPAKVEQGEKMVPGEVAKPYVAPTPSAPSLLDEKTTGVIVAQPSRELPEVVSQPESAYYRERPAAVDKEIAKVETEILSASVWYALNDYVARNIRLDEDVKNPLTSRDLADELAGGIYNILNKKINQGQKLNEEDVVGAIKTAINGLTEKYAHLKVMINTALRGKAQVIAAALDRGTAGRESRIAEDRRSTIDEGQRTPYHSLRSGTGQARDDQQVKAAEAVVPVKRVVRFTQAADRRGRLYKIHYNDERKLYFARGGILLPDAVRIGRGGMFFSSRGIPYAHMENDKGEIVRIIQDKNAMERLASEGWTFSGGTEIAYENLEYEDIFKRSLETIDVFELWNEVVRQEGNWVTAIDKFNFDGILRANLLKFDAVIGAEIRFYLKNPSAEIRRQIENKREELQKRLQAYAVQSLRDSISHWQAWYTEAYERKKLREEILGYFYKVAETARQNRSIEYTDAEILRIINWYKSDIKRQEFAMEDALTGLKKLMRLNPEDKITLGPNFTAGSGLDREVGLVGSSEDSIRQRFGLVEEVGNVDLLIAEKNKEIKELENALARASKKWNVKLVLRALVGSSGKPSIFTSLPFRRDKKVDTRVSLFNALESQTRLDEMARRAEIEKAQLERKIGESKERIDELKRQAIAAKDVYERELARYNGDTQQIPLSVVTDSLEKYHMRLGAIIYERANYQNMVIELNRLTKALVSQAEETDSKFRFSEDWLKALEGTGQAELPSAYEGPYVSGGIDSDINFGRVHLLDIQAAEQGITAVTRNLQEKLKEIPQAKRFRKLIKEREKIEEAFDNTFIENPQKALADFEKKRNEYERLEKEIGEETERLLVIVNQATEGDTRDRSFFARLVGFDRFTLDVEGVDFEAYYPASGGPSPVALGAKIKLRIGKGFYGEVKLLQEALARANNVKASVQNAVTDRILRVQINLASFRSIMEKEESQKALLAEAQTKLIAHLDGKPVNKEVLELELDKIKLELMRTERRIKELKSYFEDLVTQYRMALGISTRSELDIEKILSLPEDELASALSRVKDRIDVFRVIDQERNINLYIARARLYMAKEGKGIPADIAFLTSGIYGSAEILSIGRVKGEMIDVKEAEGEVEKAERLYTDLGSVLYNEMLKADILKKMAENVLAQKRKKLKDAERDLATAQIEEGKRKDIEGSLGVLFAEKDLDRVRQEVEEAERELQLATLTAEELNTNGASLKEEKDRPRHTINVSDILRTIAPDKDSAIDADTAQNVLDIENNILLRLLRGLTVHVGGSVSLVETTSAGGGGGGAGDLHYPWCPDTGGKDTGGQAESKGGGSQKASASTKTEIEPSAEIQFNYLLNDIFNQSRNIAKKEAESAEHRRSKADLIRTLLIRNAACDVITAQAKLDLAIEQDRNRKKDKMRVDVPYSAKPAERDFTSPLAIAEEAALNVEVSKRDLEIARYNLQQVLATTNADVVVDVDVIGGDIQFLAPKAEGEVRAASGQDAGIKALEAEQAIQNLKVRQAWMDRWLPKVRLEIALDIIKFNARAGIEIRKEIYAGGRLKAGEEINRLNELVAKYQLGEEIKGVIYRVNNLFTSLERAIEEFTVREAEWERARKEYSRRMENVREDSMDWPAYMEAIEKLEEAEINYMLAKGNYYKLYSIVRTYLDYYGITDSVIAGYRIKVERSEQPEVEQLASGEDMRVDLLKEKLGELLKEKERLKAQRERESRLIEERERQLREKEKELISEENKRREQEMRNFLKQEGELSKREKDLAGRITALTREVSKLNEEKGKIEEQKGSLEERLKALGVKRESLLKEKEALGNKTLTVFGIFAVPSPAYIKVELKLRALAIEERLMNNSKISAPKVLEVLGAKIKKLEREKQGLLEKKEELDNERKLLEDAKKRLSDDPRVIEKWIEGELREKMKEVERAEKKEEMIVRDIPWDIEHAKEPVKVSNEYRKAVTGLLDGLGITYQDTRALNINDWIEVFESHGKAHNLSGDEMLEKLSLMLEAYNQLNKEQKDELKLMCGKDNHVIGWNRHYEGFLSINQLTHLNNIKAKKDGQDIIGYIREGEDGRISLEMIGVLSYAAARKMANRDNVILSEVINKILTNEERGQRARRDEFGTLNEEEELKPYIKWLREIGMDIDAKEFMELPYNFRERIDANDRVRKIIKDILGIDLAVFNNYTDYGKIEAWNMFRLLIEISKADNEDAPYQKLENILKLYKRIVLEDAVGINRFYRDYTEERLAKLPDATRLQVLIHRRSALETLVAKLDPNTKKTSDLKEYISLTEELSVVNDEMKKEVTALREGQVNGNGVYIIRYFLESKKHTDMLKDIATRNLTEREIEAFLASVREYFDFLSAMQADDFKVVRNAYDIPRGDRQFLDYTENVGLLSSLFELAKMQDNPDTKDIDESWTPDEVKYLLQRVHDTKEPMRKFRTIMLGREPEDIKFGPEPENAEHVGFLFGYTLRRIKDGWDRTEPIQDVILVLAGEFKEKGLLQRLGKTEAERIGQIMAMAREIVEDYPTWMDFFYPDGRIKEKQARDIPGGGVESGQGVEGDKVTALFDILDTLGEIDGRLEKIGITDRQASGVKMAIAREIMTNYESWSAFFTEKGKVRMPDTPDGEVKIDKLFEVVTNLAAIGSHLENTLRDQNLTPSELERRKAGTKMAIARGIATEPETWQMFFTENGKIQSEDRIIELFEILGNLGQLNSILSKIGITGRKADGMKMAVARDIAGENYDAWMKFFNKKGLTESDEQKANIIKLFDAFNNLRRIDGYLSDIGIIGSEAEGLKMAVARDVAGENYDTWNAYFTQTGEIKDGDKVAQLFGKLKDAEMRKEIETLLRVVTQDAEYRLNLRRPQDMGLVMSWTRGRLLEGWDETLNDAKRYIDVIESQIFSEYLRELNISDNFRQDLSKSFSSIKSKEGRERFYDLMGYTTYFATGWVNQEQLDKELSHRTAVLKKFKDYFTTQHKPVLSEAKPDASKSERALLGFIDLMKRLRYQEPVSVNNIKIENAYDLNKFIYFLKKEAELKKEGKVWSEERRRKEDEKFDLVFFESTVLTFDRMLSLYINENYEIKDINEFINNFHNLYRLLTIYPIESEVDNPITRHQLNIFRSDLQGGYTQISNDDVERLFIETKRYGLVTFWIKQLYTDTELHNYKDLYDEIMRRIAIWRYIEFNKLALEMPIGASEVGFLAKLYKKIWKYIGFNRSALDVPIGASEVGFLAKLYKDKIGNIGRLFFERAVFVQGLAKNHLGRKLVFDELVYWVGQYSLMIDNPLSSQFGNYTQLAKKKMERMFKDIIPNDPDKAHIRKTQDQDERMRIALWQGASRMGKDLIFDKTADHVWMSLLKDSYALEDEKYLNGLFDIGKVAVLRFRDMIFNEGLLIEPQKSVREDADCIRKYILRRLLTRVPERYIGTFETSLEFDKFIKHFSERLKIDKPISSNLSTALAKLSRQQVRAYLDDIAVLSREIKERFDIEMSLEDIFNIVHEFRTNKDVEKILCEESAILKYLVFDINRITRGTVANLSEEEKNMSMAKLVNYLIGTNGLTEFISKDLKLRFTTALRKKSITPLSLKMILADLGNILRISEDADNGFTSAHWRIDIKDEHAIAHLLRMLSEARQLGIEEADIIDRQPEPVLTDEQRKRMEDFNGDIMFECRDTVETHMKGLAGSVRPEGDKLIEMRKKRGSYKTSFLGWLAVGLTALTVFAHFIAWKQRKSAATPASKRSRVGGSAPRGSAEPPLRTEEPPATPPRQPASQNALGGLPFSLIFYLVFIIAQAVVLGIFYNLAIDWANLNVFFAVIILFSYVWLNLGNAIVLTDRIVTTIRRAPTELEREDYSVTGIPDNRKTAILIPVINTKKDGAFKTSVGNLIEKTLLKNRDKNIIGIIYHTAHVEERELGYYTQIVSNIRHEYGLSDSQFLYFHRSAPTSLNADEQGDIVNLEKKFGAITEMMRFLGEGLVKPSTETESYTGRTLRRGAFLLSGILGIAVTVLALHNGLGLFDAAVSGLAVSSITGYLLALFSSGATTRKARLRGATVYIQDARKEEPFFDCVNGDLTALGFASSDFDKICDMPREKRLNEGRKLWALFLLDDKNYAGNTVAEAVRIMIKELLIQTGQARIESDLEIKAEEIIRHMEEKGIINVPTTPNQYENSDRFNLGHAGDIINHLKDVEGFSKELTQIAQGLYTYLDKHGHYQPIRKAIEIMAHDNQDFAAFGNVWIDGPEVDIRAEKEEDKTNTIWEYWMWNAAKSGKFFETSMQMHTKRASFYGKGLCVIDRWLNPRKTKAEISPGMFSIGIILGAILGFIAGMVFTGEWRFGMLIGVALGSLLGAFEGRFHRGVLGAGYAAELSHDYFEADNAGAIHLRRVSIYEPGAVNYITQKDERGLFRWFMGVLVYYRHMLGPGVTMADRWINFLAVRMYLNEFIFFIFLFGTLVLGPAVSGTVNSLLFGPRLIEFASPLIMLALLGVMFASIILLPNIIFRDLKSSISRRQMWGKVIVTTAVFLNNVSEGTKRLFTNLPRVLIYGTHPRFTVKEHSLWLRFLMLVFALPGMFLIAYFAEVWPIQTLLFIAVISVLLPYIISRILRRYVSIGWIVAGLVVAGLFVSIPVILGINIDVGTLGESLNKAISSALHPLFPNLTPKMVNASFGGVKEYMTNLRSGFENTFLWASWVFAPIRWAFDFISQNSHLMPGIIKGIGIVIILKWITKLLKIMKEPMPWKGTLATRGGSKEPTLYATAKNIRFSFILALIPVISAAFLYSNLWPLIFAFPVIYAWSIGYIHIWYTAKPMWYKGGSEDAVRTGPLGFARSLPRAIWRDVKLTWTQGVVADNEDVTPVMRIRHFVSIITNIAFIAGTIAGIGLMFAVLYTAYRHVVGIMPFSTVSTLTALITIPQILLGISAIFVVFFVLPYILARMIKNLRFSAKEWGTISIVFSALFFIATYFLCGPYRETCLMAIQLIFGTFIASFVLPQIFGYIFAFIPAIIEWVLDQIIYFKEELKWDKRSGSLLSEIRNIGLLFRPSKAVIAGAEPEESKTPSSSISETREATEHINTKRLIRASDIGIGLTAGCVIISLTATGFILPIAFIISGSLILTHSSIQGITSFFITRAFMKSNISIRGPDGEEQPITRFNTSNGEIEYLCTDNIYRTENDIKNHKKVLDNLPRIPIITGIIKFLIVSHEKTHALLHGTRLEKYGETLAYTIPFIGIFNARVNLRVMEKSALALLSLVYIVLIFLSSCRHIRNVVRSDPDMIRLAIVILAPLIIGWLVFGAIELYQMYEKYGRDMKELTGKHVEDLLRDLPRDRESLTRKDKTQEFRDVKMIFKAIKRIGSSDGDVISACRKVLIERPRFYNVEGNFFMGRLVCREFKILKYAIKVLGNIYNEEAISLLEGLIAKEPQKINIGYIRETIYPSYIAYIRYNPVLKQAKRALKRVKKGIGRRSKDSGKTPAVPIETSILDQIPPAAESPIKLVILDHGNVIMRFDYRGVARALAERFGVDEKIAYNFCEERHNNPINPIYKYEHNQIDEQTLTNEVGQWLEDTLHKTVELTLAEFEKIFNAVWLDYIEETLSLIRVLREKGYKVRVMTTTSRIHYKTDAEPGGVVELLENGERDIYASFLRGYTKPDPRSYLEVCEGAVIPPENTLFVDDKQFNADGAINAGLKATLFNPQNVDGSIGDIVSVLRGRKAVEASPHGKGTTSRRGFIGAMFGAGVLSAIPRWVRAAAEGPTTRDVVKENARYFQFGAGVDKATGLPYDHITVSKANRITETGRYVNPTTIGLYLNVLAGVANGDIAMEGVTPKEAVARIWQILAYLSGAEKWNGLFYWYDLSTGRPVKIEKEGISAIDNGNLAASLGALIGAFQKDAKKDLMKGKLVEVAYALINRQTEGWAKLYDKDKGLLYAGYRPNENKYYGYYLDRFYNETRIAVIWAILHSSGRVPVSALTNMERPTTTYAMQDGRKIDTLMPWEGTAFQAWMPMLFFNEKDLSPELAKIHRNFLDIQTDYAKRNGLAGLLSNSSTTNDGYHSFGVKPVAETVVRYRNQNAVSDDTTSPHASALAALVDLKKGQELVNNLAKQYPSLATPYGFRDAVDRNGRTGGRILGLDQAMLILALEGPKNAEYVSSYLSTTGKLDLLREIYASQKIQPQAKAEPRERPSIARKIQAAFTIGLLIPQDFSCPDQYTIAKAVLEEGGYALQHASKGRFLENQREALSNRLNRLFDITQKGPKDVVLVVTTDREVLRRMQRRVATANIDRSVIPSLPEHTIVIHPYYFTLSEKEQLEILYEQIISRIDKGLRDDRELSKDRRIMEVINRIAAETTSINELRMIYQRLENLRIEIPKLQKGYGYPELETAYSGWASKEYHLEPVNAEEEKNLVQKAAMHYINCESNVKAGRFTDDNVEGESLVVVYCPEKTNFEIIGGRLAACLWDGELLEYESTFNAEQGKRQEKGGLLELYNKLIQEHVRLDRIFEQDLQSPRMEHEEVLRLDTVHKKIHRQIVLIGILIGVSPVDSHYAIALDHGNLERFGLPEVATAVGDKDNVKLLLPIWRTRVDYPTVAVPGASPKEEGKENKEASDKLQREIKKRFGDDVDYRTEKFYYGHKYWTVNKYLSILTVPYRLLSQVAELLKECVPELVGIRNKERHSFQPMDALTAALVTTLGGLIVIGITYSRLCQVPVTPDIFYSAIQFFIIPSILAVAIGLWYAVFLFRPTFWALYKEFRKDYGILLSIYEALHEDLAKSLIKWELVRDEILRQYRHLKDSDFEEEYKIDILSEILRDKKYYYKETGENIEDIEDTEDIAQARHAMTKVLSLQARRAMTRLIIKHEKAPLLIKALFKGAAERVIIHEETPKHLLGMVTPLPISGLLGIVVTIYLNVTAGFSFGAAVLAGAAIWQISLRIYNDIRRQRQNNERMLALIGIPKENLKSLGLGENPSIRAIENKLTEMTGYENIEVILLDGTVKENQLSQLRNAATDRQSKRRGIVASMLLDLGEVKFDLKHVMSERILKGFLDRAIGDSFAFLSPDVETMSRGELINYIRQYQDIESIGLNQKSLYELSAMKLYSSPGIAGHLKYDSGTLKGLKSLNAVKDAKCVVWTTTVDRKGFSFAVDIKERRRQMGVTKKNDPIKDILVVKNMKDKEVDAYLEATGLDQVIDRENVITDESEAKSMISIFEKAKKLSRGVTLKKEDIVFVSASGDNLEHDRDFKHINIKDAAKYNIGAYRWAVELVIRGTDALRLSGADDRLAGTGILNLFEYIPLAEPFDYEKEFESYRAYVEEMLTKA